jgi:ATP/maltotriose-dependent transcriptional regulator MalT
MRGDYKQAAMVYSDVAARYQGLGNTHAAAVSRCYLAAVLWKLEDRSQAVRLVQEGIRTSVLLENRFLLCLCLDLTLLLGTEQDNLEQRARLLGAADTLRQTVGYAQSIWRRRLVTDEHRECLRQQIEHEGIGAMYREGRSLGFTRVVHLAHTMLEDLGLESSCPETIGDVSVRGNPLSSREQQVLRLVANGLSDKQIARAIAVGERTVRRHLTSILNKLGAGNRPQAVAIAAQRRLL